MINGAETLAQEGSTLTGYYTELFNSPSWLPQMSVQEWDWQYACPADQDELASYLMHLPTSKAVPRNCAAGSAWRLALQLPLVRSLIYATVVRFPVDGVPSSFKNGSLLLLQKPSKSGKQVEHFRPLVLQCPIGKMILKYFTEKLVFNIRDRILSTPQFAYLARRSTLMAIHRVMSFLNERFHTAGSPQPPPFLLKAGYLQKPCSGCLVLSIDLRQAFDRVHRPQLIQYLRKMRIDDDLIGVFQSWHVDTKYFLEHAHSTYTIYTTRGVRQGCTAAPVLWLVFLYNVLEGLGEVEERNWYEIVTAFADDLIFCYPINCVEDIARVLASVRKLLEYLDRHGLVINLDKTQYLFKLYGSQAVRHWNTHTYRDGGKRRLRLTTSYHPFLTEKLEYLGAVLAWKNSGDVLLSNRINKAHGAYALLRPWWRTPALSQACKLKLYKTMVLPVLMYGVGSSGVSPKGELRLKKVVVKQLRAIFRCPVHLTRESDSALFRRLRILPPAISLQIACCRLARQLLPEVNWAAYVGSQGLDQTLKEHLDTRSTWSRCVVEGLKLLHPRLSEQHWDGLTAAQLRAMLAGMDEKMFKTDHLESLLWPKAPPSDVSTAVPLLALEDKSDHVCSTCGRSFPSYNQLRSHQYKMQCGWIEKRPDTYFPGVDSVTALPACRWCGARFLRWAGIKTHIEHGQCPRASDRLSWLASDSILQFHLDQDLRSHCVICSRWFRFPRNLSRHLLASHGDAYKEGMERYKALDLRPCLKSCTCLVCGHTSSDSRNHWQHMDGRCMTLLQRCMARVPDPVTSSAYPDDEQVDCETRKRPQQHLQEHQLTSIQQHLPQHPHLPRQRSIEHLSSNTQHADSFYKFVRPSRCPTTRRLGRSSSPRSCQQACTHYPFNKPREEQGREGQRQGQGTEKGQKQEQGEGQGPVQQSWHKLRRLTRKTPISSGSATARAISSDTEIYEPGGPFGQSGQRNSRMHVGSEQEMERLSRGGCLFDQRTVEAGAVQGAHDFSSPEAYAVVKRIRGKQRPGICAQRGQVLLRAGVGSGSRSATPATRWTGHHAGGIQQASRRNCTSDSTRGGGEGESPATNGVIAREHIAPTSPHLLSSYQRGNASPSVHEDDLTHVLLEFDFGNAAGGEREDAATGGTIEEADLCGLKLQKHAIDSVEVIPPSDRLC